MEIIYKTEKKGNITLKVDDYLITLQIEDKTFTSDYGFLKQLNKKLTDVDRSLFDLLIWLLLFNLDTVEVNSNYKIKQTGKAIVSYSGGVDSTALLSLFGGTPVHITRSYNEEYESRQIKACDFVNSYNIISDFEKVRELYLGKHGFNVGVGYACLYFPILELLNCDTIYFGVVFDDLGFYYSEPFKFNGNIKNSSFHRVNEVINKHNIKIRLPLAGYSEVLTTRIADESGINNFSSCHTFGENSSCGKCYKCFRKQGIRGSKIDLTDPINNNRMLSILKKQPLKMASSTIWGIQNAKYKGSFYEKYYNIDVSWCERVNKYYNDEFGLGGDSIYGFQTENDLKLIDDFVNYINDDNNYK